jgi:hypothetical protein
MVLFPVRSRFKYGKESLTYPNDLYAFETLPPARIEPLANSPYSSVEGH